MENKKWLPSDTRNRLIDLCKDRNISQAQLAGVIGIDRSALSRFHSGKTDSMSHEHVIAIRNTSMFPRTFFSAKQMIPDGSITISGNWG